MNAREFEKEEARIRRLIATASTMEKKDRQQAYEDLFDTSDDYLFYFKKGKDVRYIKLLSLSLVFLEENKAYSRILRMETPYGMANKIAFQAIGSPYETEANELWINVHNSRIKHSLKKALTDDEALLVIVSDGEPERCAFEQTIVMKGILPHLKALSDISRRRADEIRQTLKVAGYERELLEFEARPAEPAAREAGAAVRRDLGRSRSQGCGPNDAE